MDVTPPTECLHKITAAKKSIVVQKRTCYNAELVSWPTRSQLKPTKKARHQRFANRIHHIVQNIWDYNGEICKYFGRGLLTFW